MDTKLDTSRKKEITELAKKILRESSCFYPKFDLIKLLQDEENFQIICQNMQDETTGYILINDNEFIPGTTTHKLIAVNNCFENDANFLQRRRFIVAHEFAHSVLHKNDALLYAHRDVAHRNDILEKEADYFALCLLMPEELVKTVLNDNSKQEMSFEQKVDCVSEAFYVTEKKARERLKELYNVGSQSDL